MRATRARWSARARSSSPLTKPIYAELTDALTDSPNFVLERTKYYDFEGGTEWRAQRELVPA